MKIMKDGRAVELLLEKLANLQEQVSLLKIELKSFGSLCNNLCEKNNNNLEEKEND